MSITLSKKAMFTEGCGQCGGRGYCRVKCDRCGGTGYREHYGRKYSR